MLKRFMERREKKARRNMLEKRVQTLRGELDERLATLSSSAASFTPGCLTSRYWLEQDAQNYAVAEDAWLKAVGALRVAA